MTPPPVSRRDVLRRAGCGFGALAFAGLCTDHARAAARNPLAAKPPLLAARAKRVLFVFMHGGPPQTELFDPKMDAPSEIRSAVGEIPTTIPGVTGIVWVLGFANTSASLSLPVACEFQVGDGGSYCEATRTPLMKATKPSSICRDKWSDCSCLPAEE